MTSRHHRPIWRRLTATVSALLLSVAGVAVAGPAHAAEGVIGTLYVHSFDGDKLDLTAPSNGSTPYELRNYIHGCGLFLVGCLTWDETVSSLTVRSYGKVTLFDGPAQTGNCITFTNHAPFTRSFDITRFPVALTAATPALDGAIWNDRTSSVIATYGAVTPPAAARCPVEGDILPGMGFEDMPGTGLVQPWQAEGTGAKGINYHAGTAQTGWNNAWIRTGGTGWNSIKRQDVQLTPGFGYRVRAWVRTSPNFRDGYMGLRPAGSPTPFREVRFAASPAGQYTLIEVRLRAVQYHYTFFLGYWAPSGDSWVRIDNISIQHDDRAELPS